MDDDVDVDELIRQAWRRIGPGVLADRAELARRLERGRRAGTRPPRAWCVAVRASDRRLPRAWLVPDVDAHGNAIEVDDVTLDVATLRALTCPAHAERVAGRLDDVAERLGVTRAGLLQGRVDGTFDQTYVPGLGGRGGKPRPVLRATRDLDPNARTFATADPVWTHTATYVMARIPDDLAPQCIRRVQVWQRRGPGYRDTADLHPEHPALDPPPPRRRKSLALPPPAAGRRLVQVAGRGVRRLRLAQPAAGRGAPPAPAQARERPRRPQAAPADAPAPGPGPRLPGVPWLALALPPLRPARERGVHANCRGLPIADRQLPIETQGRRDPARAGPFPVPPSAIGNRQSAIPRLAIPSLRV